MGYGEENLFQKLKEGANENLVNDNIFGMIKIGMPREAVHEGNNLDKKKSNIHLAIKPDEKSFAEIDPTDVIDFWVDTSLMGESLMNLKDEIVSPIADRIDLLCKSTFYNKRKFKFKK